MNIPELSADVGFIHEFAVDRKYLGISFEQSFLAKLTTEKLRQYHSHLVGTYILDPLGKKF